MKSKSYGLDVGQANIDLAFLKKTGKVITLEDYFEVSRLEDEENSDALTPDEVLRNIFIEKKVENESLNMSTNDQDLMIFSIDLPKMPPKELENALRNSIEQRLPYSMAEAAYDFDTEQKGNTFTYSIYCSTMQHVMEHYNWLKELGVEASSVQTEMLAATYCLLFNNYFEDIGEYLIVDVGRSHLGFGVVRDKKLATNYYHPLQQPELQEGELEMDEDITGLHLAEETERIILHFEEKGEVGKLKKIIILAKGDLVDKIVKNMKESRKNVMAGDPLKEIQLGKKMPEDFDKKKVSCVSIGLALGDVVKVA